MPSVCELKIALKAKGIKGITGLNKAGLEALLNKGTSNQEPKEPPKPKPFTPAATKGDTPKVAEKKITKKEKPPQILRLTYKEPSESKKETKAAPKLNKPKQTESERIKMLKTKREGDDCNKLMKKAGLKTAADLRNYIIANHPDKVKNYDPNSAAANLYKELLNCSSVYKNIKGYLEDGLIKGFKGLM
jgi:outer membrane biosynthesis protein TonB